MCVLQMPGQFIRRMVWMFVESWKQSLWTIRDAWTEGDSIGQGERSELKVEQIMHDFKLFGSLKIGEAREIIISPK